MDKKYNVKTKVDGKYWSFGNIQPGQYGPRLGMKVTPELRKLLADAHDGTWLNFSLFEDDGKYGKQQTTYAGDDNTQDVPF